MPDHDELLQEAWGVIANAGWDEQERSPGWQEAAERWRDRYHAYLAVHGPSDEDGTK
jgi:hypothetical protein